MIYITPHPGPWFDFCKRPENENLSLTEATLKYKKQVLLFEDGYSNFLFSKQMQQLSQGAKVNKNKPIVFIPLTKSELQTAVDLWVSDEPQALATYGEINTWVTTNITDMSFLFQAKGLFNSDISNWDVSNVTNMSAMFATANSFNQPIGNWNTSRVSDMSTMFFGNSSFNQPIGDWDVSNVTNILQMFAGSSPFQISPFDQPLNNWNVSSVINMETVFGFSAFNQPLDKWKVGSVTTMRSMFIGNALYNQDLSFWDVNGVQDYENFDSNTPSWTLPKPNFV